MANAISNVSFTSPGYDYSADLSEIERRKAYAQALQQQSMQPIQAPQQPGSRIHPFQGLAKILQSRFGTEAAEGAEQQQRTLAEKARQDLADVLRRGGQAAAGAPPIPMPPDEQGGGPGAPAQAPDMGRASEIYMQHPMTAPMGMATAQTEMQNRQRQQMLASILGGGVAPQQGQPQGAGAPAAGGGAFAGMPPQVMALMTSGDPELVKLGTTLMEANKGIAQRPGAPVVNPFTGAVIAQPTPTVPAGMQLSVGPGGPQAAPLPGFGAAQTGLHNIPRPDAPMVKMPTSGGQTIELTQPEYLQWQQTGNLPQRFGGAQGQTPAPAGPSAGAPRPAPAGLGVPGMSQPQEDVIRQARQTTAGKAVDEAFAKDYVQFSTGGAQDAMKQIAQLTDVQKALLQPSAGLTGPMRGRLPDVVRSVTNPQAIAMRERVEEVVQRSLRAILGAQFTEKEGERLIARAYNPALGEKENAVRVNRLTTQLQQAFEAKQDAAKYFEKNNTLEGWKGKLPSMSDFDPEVGKAGKLSAAEEQELIELRKRFGRP